MRFTKIALSCLLGLSSLALATPVEQKNEPRREKVTVAYPDGTVVGRSLMGTETFASIPFTEPPVGDLRLRPPVRYSGMLNDHDGTGISPACPQQYVDTDAKDLISEVASIALQLPLLQELTGQEDCLKITVQRPAGTKAGDNLPVLFWIYGGGFVLGATNTYDATQFLETAVAQRQPFIFVAVNYRLNGFGFLAGKEVLDAGSANLGLLDQRMGLEWVSDNIGSFGGDPDKVTIWGESAGSISVFDQLLLYGGNATYNGRSLFRGAIMNSGSIIPADSTDSAPAQEVYDAVVEKAGCSGAADSIECLRAAPYDTFYDAVTSIPGLATLNKVVLKFLPRPDGRVLVKSPDVMAKQGHFHQTPIIIGNQEDEGTVFSILLPKLSTTERIVNYVSENVLLSAPKNLIRQFVELYPTSIFAGSPFRTGVFNELFPGFKRLAAFLGDAVLTLTRRVALRYMHAAKPDMKCWSYLASYFYGTPVVGTLHGSDVIQIFYGPPASHATSSIRTYYLNFIHNLDPNKGVEKYAKWPLWGEGNKLMWFKTMFGNDLLDDDFRQESADFLEQNAASFLF
jgi:carboxylesterase type B